MNWKHMLATRSASAELRYLGIGVALPAGAAPTQTPATSAPSSTTSCEDGHWPLVVDGRPTQLAPGAAGRCLPVARP